MLDIDRVRDARQLDRWTIGAEVGRGGMGVVYAATGRDDGAPCAIKFLLPDTAPGTGAAALVEREIAHSLSLEHPNIVRTHASGLVADTPFVVMELCEHGSLAQQVVMDGPLPVDRAVPLILDTLAGLRHAHTAPVRIATADGTEIEAAGLVHRDVKPPNILLARNGAKVADFGLAKAFQLAGLSGLTRTGVTAGTPAFMPRQQVVDFKYATPSVDVWAAAASLYFALTAHPPRDFLPGRDPWVTAYRTRPVPVRERGVPLPARLADLVDEALVDDPEPAFVTAGELIDALRGV